MIGRRLAVGMLAVALVVAGCGAGESAGEPSDGVDRGEAAPVPGVSKLVTLLNGDTLTVPLDYEFRDLLGFESLGGDLANSAGERILTFDACGDVEAYIGADNGEHGRAVNIDFYYGRLRDDIPVPVTVSFEARGPCNLLFTDVLSEQDALGLARTYTAVGKVPPYDCVFQDP